MPSINSILKIIKSDYPEFSFEASDSFSWSHQKSHITYKKTSLESEWPLLLHELAHGLLAHQNYDHSLDLMQIERDAWDYAKILAGNYDLSVSEDVIERSLDTYRDWLHKRSTCPKCGGTGIESDNRKFSCPECLADWRVNDARICALRRYKVK